MLSQGRKFKPKAEQFKTRNTEIDSEFRLVFLFEEKSSFSTLIHSLPNPDLPRTCFPRVDPVPTRPPHSPPPPPPTTPRTTTTMPRKASSTSDSRLKWRKRKRNPTASPSPSRRSSAVAAAADHSDDSDSAAVNEDDDSAVPEDADDETLAGAEDPVLDLREAEVLPSAEPVSAFPVATRRVVNRPHPSVLAVIAAERSACAGEGSAAVAAAALENISYGQQQVLSGVLPDHASLATDTDKPSTYVCTPPNLMEGHGVTKQFQGRLHVVPKHSGPPALCNQKPECLSYNVALICLRFVDWFSPGIVHRLERQVVPQFFSGKSPGNTPEKYMLLRNKVIAKYLENPSKRLAFAECQGLVANTAELYDLSRIVRFLDTWGIINYLASGSVHRGLRMATSLLREEPTGELQLLTAPLKSIDGLILFDRPKCSLQAEDISSLASNSEVVHFDAGLAELDEKIRERLSETFDQFALSVTKGDGLLENIEVPDVFVPFRAETNGYPHSDCNGSTSGNLPQRIPPGNQLPFINSSNPVMSLVGFLASAIGPRVAASCASAALSDLTIDDDSRVNSEDICSDARGHGAHPNFRDHNGGVSSSISPEKVKHAAMCGLSAAATKAKLFADQEEREIQRLTATVINHQLKRLELKLKQFAEVETLLLKECEQVERIRQRIASDRVRIVSTRLASPGNSLPGGSTSTMSSNPMSMSPRPMGVPGSMPQSSMPAPFANNMQGHGHPQMAFLQQQQQQQQRQQMLSFGPRLPLSAIQTQPSPQTSNIMFNPGMPNSVTPNHHQLLRSSSGNNSSVG
uniref:SWIRM domain-containing protein n=1 Tax=Oryza meridionalis TaxID=40149 RepID=A0A0E0F330_9ORYZ